MHPFLPPKDDHHDVHHHPDAADEVHPNQRHLQEVQGQLGGKSSSQVQATICTSVAVTVPPKPTFVRTLCWKTLTSVLRGLSCCCTVSVKEKPPTDH